MIVDGMKGLLKTCQCIKKRRTDDQDGAPEGQSDPGVENCVAVHHPLNQKRQFCYLNVRPRTNQQPVVAQTGLQIKV